MPKVIDTTYGTSEHAARVTEGRHPGVRDGLQWLTFAHLPEALQRFSIPFYMAAVRTIEEITTDSPELTTAINRLIEAKDSAVRAGIRHDTGRAGAVPRPQEVTEPPQLAEETDWAETARDLTSDDPQRIAKHMPNFEG